MKRILLVSVVALFVGCSVDYTYEVKGSANTAMITYTTADGSISQETTAVLPWKKELSGNVGDIVTLSAQNNDNRGNIVIEIHKEGVLLKSSESVGPYGMSTVGGTL